jgi:hypothetical protein
MRRNLCPALTMIDSIAKCTGGHFVGVKITEGVWWDLVGLLPGEGTRVGDHPTYRPGAPIGDPRDSMDLRQCIVASRRAAPRPGSTRYGRDSPGEPYRLPRSPYEPASPQEPPARGTHFPTLAVCLVGRYFRILNYTSASERADHGDDWRSPQTPGLQG